MAKRSAIEKVLWACGALAAISTAALTITNWYDKAPVPASIREFHEQDVLTDREQANRTEGKITAMTIPPIVAAIRHDPCEDRWRNLLEERLQEYKRLMGNAYTLGPLPPCEETS